MAFGLALSKFRELQSGEIAATFVVPAPLGCNLNCSFCFIRQRHEAGSPAAALSVEDYLHFLDELNQCCRIGVVSLQGYEPLLAESWPFSEAILRRAREMGIDTALVTNGTFLADRVADLVRLDVQGVTVSLDSADPAIHDRSRGTPGAFAAALAGLQAACATELHTRILVNSVLQPRKLHYLHDLPAFLSSLGLRQWIVTPMYRVGRDSAGSPSEDADGIVFQLRRLNSVATRHGVQLIVDDEFKSLAKSLNDRLGGDALFARQLKRLDQVVRLSPQGACSVGSDILRRADSGVPVWRPEVEQAGAFIQRALEPKISGHSEPRAGA